MRGMTFHDLPKDWRNTPLIDPTHIANVLDVFVSLEDRARNSLLILICDEGRRPFQPVIVNEIDSGSPYQARPFLERLARTVADANPNATILFAIARRDRLRVSRNDREWKRAIEASFGDSLEVMGVHVITFEGSIPIPDLAAAA